jgi:hypothetical protein
LQASLRFLSPEWLAALGELVPLRPSPGSGGTDEPDGEGEGEGERDRSESLGTLALGQIVEGGPDGDVAYTIHLGVVDAGNPQVVEGTVDQADVVLVESYEAARGLASGELSPSDAIRAGQVKVRGAARLLTAHQDLLVALGEALADLRSRTTF